MKVRRLGNRNLKLAGKRAFYLSLGALAIGGSIYFIARNIIKRKESSREFAEESEAGSEEKSGMLKPKRIFGAGDKFPLKRGSRGEKVRQLQAAIQNIIGNEAMKRFTSIDGNFEKGTADSLKAAGFPAVVDENIFAKIISVKKRTAAIKINPVSLASKLYRFAQEKNFDGVMESLKALKNTGDYSEANKYFIALQLFSVSKSIVSYLLESFSTNSLARVQIGNEFKRIGLRLDESSGKWSLSGFREGKGLLTLADSYVQGSFGEKIRVKKNTILGEEKYISNGRSFFKSIDGLTYSIPTIYVKYTL